MELVDFIRFEIDKYSNDECITITTDELISLFVYIILKYGDSAILAEALFI